MPAYRFEESYMTAADGVRLFTRTVFPLSYREGEKLPTVIVRTPYEADAAVWPFDPATLGGVYAAFLDRGYALVDQHCRGTGSSEGEFRNMQHEREDGLCLLDWVRAQRFYDGSVFLYGNSYKSFVHSCILGENPPDVRGAALGVMPADMSLCCYEKNTFKHDLYTMWFAKTFRCGSLDMKKTFAKMREELPKRPMTTLSRRVYGEAVAELDEAFSHAPGDPFWSNPESGFGQSREAPLKTKIPLLLVGGFYDIHFAGTVRYFSDLNEEVRPKSALFLGPWTHSLTTLPEHRALFPGSSHFPVEAEWFDHIRLGTPLHYVTEGKITYYRTGDGWRRTERLGADAETRTVLYPRKDGGLSSSPETDGTGLFYTFDPEHPVSLPGGASIFQTPLRGPQPQPAPGETEGLLSFVSEPLTEHVCADGPIDVNLTVSTDCPDTAFFVRLDAVLGDTAYCLRDTVVTLSDFVPDYEPGKKARISFSLDPVAWHFRPGDRLRIDVSSSNFPTYHVHSNTKERWNEATEVRVARNGIYPAESSFSFASTERTGAKK